jgi:hypothetical protein
MSGRRERLGCYSNDITTYSRYVNRMGEFDDDDNIPPPSSH